MGDETRGPTSPMGGAGASVSDDTGDAAARNGVGSGEQEVSSEGGWIWSTAKRIPIIPGGMKYSVLT